MKEEAIKRSAQDFRNAYENFYNEFRNYLWPYSVLEVLASLEVEIYTAFLDLENLKKLLDKIRPSVMQAVKDFEDDNLEKRFTQVVELLDGVEAEDIYQTIGRVEEVNPDEDKQIKLESESELEEDSESM